DLHTVVEDTSYEAHPPGSYLKPYKLTLSVLGDTAYFGFGWDLLRAGAKGLEHVPADWGTGLIRGFSWPTAADIQIGGRFPDALWTRVEMNVSPDGRIHTEVTLN